MVIEPKMKPLCPKGGSIIDFMKVIATLNLSTGAGFTKTPLERTSFSKGRSFYSFGKATLKFSFTKLP